MRLALSIIDTKVHLLSSHQQPCTPVLTMGQERENIECVSSLLLQNFQRVSNKGQMYEAVIQYHPKEAEATLWFIDYTDELPLWKGQQFNWPELTILPWQIYLSSIKDSHHPLAQGFTGVWLIHRESAQTAYFRGSLLHSKEQAAMSLWLLTILILSLPLQN